jgi:hypothetical protein
MTIKECIEILDDLLISVKNENIGKCPENKNIREVMREDALAMAMRILVNLSNIEGR